MATTVGYLSGTSLTFAASGGDAIWNPHSSANTHTGRLSARLSLGVDASTVKPRLYRWDAKITMGGTAPTSAFPVYLLISEATASTGSSIHGGFSESDQALATQDFPNLKCIACLTYDGAGASTAMRQDGLLEVSAPYIQIAHFNDSTTTLSTTSGDYYLTLTPVPEAF